MYSAIGTRSLRYGDELFRVIFLLLVLLAGLFRNIFSLLFRKAGRGGGGGGGGGGCKSQAISHCFASWLAC